MHRAIVSGAAGATTLTGAYPQSKFVSQAISSLSSLGVNVANGNLQISSNDQSLAGVAGLGLSVGRFYNNLTSANGAFGQGWSMGPGADTTLSASCSNTNLIFSDGSGVQTTFAGASGATTLTAPAADLQLSMNGTSAAASTQFSVLLRHSGITETLIGPGGCGQVAKLSQIADRHGNTIRYSYNPAGQLNQITDSYGNQTTVYYNAAGFVSQINSPSGATSYYTQNAAGQLTSFKDADGHTTSYSYNSVGDLIQITDPDGNLINVGYDSGNRVTSIGRFVKAGDLAGPTTTFQYYYPGATACPSAATVQTGVFDGNNHPTNYCTDAQGRILQVNDANGHMRSTTYTADGNVYQQTQAVGTSMAATTTYGYDGSDNVTTVSAGTGIAGGQLNQSFGYSDSANPYLATSATDTQGNTTKTAYDAFGSPLTQTDSLAASNQATKTYNADGTVATSVDANKNTTTYSYTGHNLTLVTPPSAVPLAQLDNTRLTYDGAERVATRASVNPTVNQVDQQVAYMYDSLGQVTQATYTNAAGVQQIFSYAYDPNGHLTQETSPQGISTWTYDGLGELLKRTYANGYNPISYTYDAAGNLASLTTEAGTATYTYDPANQVTGVKDMGNANYNLSYDAAGNLTQLSYHDGDAVYFQYNAENQLTSTSNTYKTSTGANADLTFQNTWTNAAGQNTGLIQSTHQPDGSSTAYSYDALNRLSQASTTSSGTTLAQYAYTLDGDGNLLSRQVTGTQVPNLVTSYAYNAANETCWSATSTSSGTSCGSAPSGANAFGYDRYGNETQDGSGMSLAYNLLGQLMSTTKNATTQNYTYLGTDNSNLTGDAGTYMNSDQLGLSIHGDPSGTGGDYFVRSTSGQPIEQVTPHGAYDYMFDANGNVIGLTDDTTGQLVSRKTYDPYGNITTNTGTVPTFFGFQSGYQTASGLDHFGARYYSPGQQTWTQEDPVSQIGSLTESNRYGFVGENPVNQADSSGAGITCARLNCPGLAADRRPSSKAVNSAACALISTSSGLISGGIATVFGGPITTAIVGNGVATGVGFACGLL